MADTLSSDPSGFRLCFKVFQAEPSLSNFLYSRLAKNHQQQLLQLFEDECVSVDGEVATSTQALKTGQKVEIFLADHQEEPVDDHWKVLWENNELMAVYKPHLLPVSRTTRNLYNTLVSLIRRQTSYANAHLLHRLDTETAGIVLIAKNSAADKKWKPNLDKLITRKSTMPGFQVRRTGMNAYVSVRCQKKSTALSAARSMSSIQKTHSNTQNQNRVKPCFEFCKESRGEA